MLNDLNKPLTIDQVNRADRVRPSADPLGSKIRVYWAAKDETEIRTMTSDGRYVKDSLTHLEPRADFSRAKRTTRVP